MQRIQLITTIIASLAIGIQGQYQYCRLLTGSPNYTPEAYSGKWYEVAQIKWEYSALNDNCTCNTVTIQQSGQNARDLVANNTCRFQNMTGAIQNWDAYLSYSGRYATFYQEYLAPQQPRPMEYTVIFMLEINGEEFSVDYTCAVTYIAQIYQVRFLSRKTTLSSELLQQLQSQVNDLLINPAGQNLTYIKQEGCSASVNDDSNLFFQ